MKAPAIDAGRLTLLLTERHPPATKAIWSRFAEQADKEGWPAAVLRTLAALAEHELAERQAIVRSPVEGATGSSNRWRRSKDNGARRRIERHLAEARLLPGKTLETFEFEALPLVGRTVPRTVR